MGVEIERKFLVRSDAWRGLAEGEAYRQGYICVGPPAAVRARVIGNRAVLTIKQATNSIVRDEFEYAIPLAEAEAIIERLCRGRVVEKTRYRIPAGPVVWEVDEFHDRNEGLVVAEVELDDEDQVIEKPDWVGEEVSRDPRYLNTSLSERPYTEWG